MIAPGFREQHLETLPAELLRRPLDYILADHLRQRVLCVLCEQIAAKELVDVGLAREVIDYLQNDMVVHVIDEEQDLFPLIRRRAEPEDEIEVVLGQLSGEHASEENLATSIVGGLGHMLEHLSEPLPEDLRSALALFAHNERHHLALENATVVPMAKLRLTERDLKELSARMAARRGILFDAYRER